MTAPLTSVSACSEPEDMSYPEDTTSGSREYSELKQLGKDH